MIIRIRPTVRALLAGTTIVFAGCAVGPDYSRPAAASPTAYKEISAATVPDTSGGTWKRAQPDDATERGHWWEIYHDPTLNALEEQVDLSNQNLAAYEAQYREACASVAAARSNYFPFVSASPSVTRARTSANAGTGASGRTVDTFTLPGNLSYELDLWGGIRRSVEASENAAQASFAVLANARLSYQALLAQDYFLLRGLDAEKNLLESTMQSYTKYLDLTRERYKGGVDSQADISQAETQLDDARVQLIDVGVLRSHYEHAVAVLTGKPPAELAIAEAGAGPPGDPAEIPAGVPSALLERRPDIANAERLVAAANAQIGVAKAAYFPTITLAATAGWLSDASGSWFLWPSRFWSLGPTAAETLFDGGKRRAQLTIAKAGYDSTVALYRETVLEAFAQVEDDLASLRILGQEAGAEDDAVRSAQKSLAIATDQYKAGVQSYLQVITAQTTALNDELNAVKLHTSRMTASVLLIEALGGGWDASRIPDPHKIAATQ